MVSAFVLSQILIGIAFIFDMASFQFKERKCTEVRELAKIEEDLLCMAVNRAFITVFLWRCLRKHALGENEVWDANDCKGFN